MLLLQVLLDAKQQGIFGWAHGFGLQDPPLVQAFPAAAQLPLGQQSICVVTEHEPVDKTQQEPVKAVHGLSSQNVANPLKVEVAVLQFDLVTSLQFPVVLLQHAPLHV